MHEKGFTLIELLVGLLVTSLMATAIYAAYYVQQESFATQEQVVELQQNLRAAMDVMSREIRMAGYDPDGATTAGILSATSTSLSFSFVADTDGNDNDNDGTTDEPNELKTIQYLLYDAYGDGTIDLGRQVGGGLNQICERVDGLEFCYTLADGTQTLAPTSPQLNSIRAIQVSLLVRADKADPKFTDSKVYTTASGAAWGPFNDNFHRRLVITNILCRNMGLYK